jgi:hypothetical protein
LILPGNICAQKTILARFGIPVNRGKRQLI